MRNVFVLNRNIITLMLINKIVIMILIDANQSRSMSNNWLGIKIMNQPWCHIIFNSANSDFIAINVDNILSLIDNLLNLFLME